MGESKTDETIISEWKIVVEALQSHKELLEQKAAFAENKANQKELSTDIARIERLIPQFQR